MTKQHILDEIKRTAKANGGLPLGRLKFFTETEIKESDWKGVHWARWNDAVREAGVTPNKKTEAYDEEWLVEKLIALARELGHFRIFAELRMKSRNDSDFPNDKTFSSRFGPKQQMISKVTEFCRKHEGFEDVLDLCEAAAVEDTTPSDESVESTQEIGFVYLLKSGRFYKIGRSNSSGRREYELAIQLPEKANVAHQIRTDDPVGIEAYWHKRFESRRKNGEWFELSASDIKAFKRRKFM
jgi:hypothetical protein